MGGGVKNAPRAFRRVTLPVEPDGNACSPYGRQRTGSTEKRKSSTPKYLALECADPAWARLDSNQGPTDYER
jgi:hypothetical protein